MKTIRWLILILAFLPVTMVPGSEVLADDRSRGEESQDQHARLQVLVEAAVGWYELLPDAATQTPMQSKVVLRWINASRGQKGEDILVLWIHDGRPEAAATIFPKAREGFMCHEFASLSRDRQLVAKDGDKVVWSPNAGGVDFQDVPGAPIPAESPTARLRQMKSLADHFEATMTGLNADGSDREKLRLLPTPVYRYDLQKAESAKLRDGAVFAYVQGTDPEVLLLLEAVREDEHLRWQYSFARATAGGLEARLADKVVWMAKKFPNDNQFPTSPQFTLQRAIQE